MVHLRASWHLSLSAAPTSRNPTRLPHPETVSEMSSGAHVEPSKVTLASYLDRWLEHMRSQVSPRTHERYSEIARKNIVPVFGNVTLTKLRPDQIAAAYTKALAEGRRDGKGGLSPNTVVYIHRILKHAL